jgi:hypothetical protein
VPRLHALELLPDEAGRAAVLRDWEALRAAGLPSQLDHTGATNTPHVTLLSAPDVSGALEAVREHVLPVLPVTVRVSGVLLLGGRALTLARAVDVPDQLAVAVAACRRLVDSQHDGWLPHVTLARRLPRDQVQRAVDALGHDDVPITLVGVRRWDPDAGTVTPLG